MDLLERDSELTVVESFIRDVENADRARLLVVEGPAGIGKTRLLQATKSLGEDAGAIVLTARGSEFELGFAYGIVRQLLEPYAARLAPAERRDLFAGPAVAAEPLFAADHGQSSELSADSSFASLHGLYWLIVNLTARGSVLLVIDDLQWCDSASLRWLAYLMPRFEGLPLGLIIGMRSGESTPNDLVIDQILADQAAAVLRPPPLTVGAARALLAVEAFGDPDEAFVEACHSETGGNPLLLRQLIDTLSTERVSPTSENAPMVSELGAGAVERMVLLRLSRLSTEASDLARSIALLGDDAEIEHAAAVADLPLGAASAAADELARVDILHDRAPLQFVHPVVRSAIYARLGILGRYQGHTRAARLLAGIAAEPERVAVHLMRVPAVSEPWAVTVLRAAADKAVARGASDMAVEYLRRCLVEPMDDGVRFEVRLELGVAARQLDLAEAAEHLRQALDLTDDAYQRAHIADLLGQALIFLMRSPEAVAVLDEAAAALPDAEVDLRRRLDASIAQVPLGALDHQGLLSRLPRLRALPPHDSLGGRTLDCVLAIHETYIGDPGAVDRAVRGLAGGLLIERINGEVALLDGWLALLAADRIDEAMTSIDAAIAQAHRHGSVTALSLAYGCKSLAWMFSGQLGEAEASGRESIHLMGLARADVVRPFAASRLADALLEQGRIDEAESVLDSLVLADPEPDSGAYGWWLDTRARLLRKQGKTQDALASALACGRRFAPHGDNSSPLVAWRAEIALCLHALTRTDEAREYAGEDLRLARDWAAARPLGRALRVAGLVEGGRAGLELLEESVAVLEGTRAGLEHAKSLVDLGAALRRANQRSAARPLLTQGYELARICGSEPTASLARAELRAAGGRARTSALTGVSSLTPSEHRVAELAATGSTNREIAQMLYVTPKTVEVHLSSTYRKLGIGSRHELVRVFTDR